MYSVVLMAALTTSVDLPDRGGRGGCCGCYGGGYSYGCCGCYGGYGMGMGCYGGYGMGMGGYGMSMCYGGYGLGGYSMAYGPAADETQEEFNYCQQRATQMPPQEYQNFRDEWLRKTHPERRRMMEGKDKGSSSLSSSAQIVVTLPADATLSFDEEATQSVGSRRSFFSPPLESERSYWYTLKAQFVRDGKTVSRTKKVAVSAGKETLVSFDESPEPRVARK